MKVLALDAGTTGVTALVLDAQRRVLGRAAREFAQHYPRPGWVEHDAAEIAAVAREVVGAALGGAGVRPGDVAALGITNQRETTVLWDRATGEPVHRALVWQDRRTAARCDELRPDWQERVRDRTGRGLDPYFCATKLEWLLENVDGARARAERGELAFGTVDAWLAWSLTGVHATDPTNASRTLLWDLHRGDWDPDLLSLFDVPESVLPDVVPSSGAVGEVREGPLAGVPVAGLVGDQQAALFGQRCLEAGQAKNTYGTGCFLLQHTGDEAVRSEHGLLTTRAASLGGRGGGAARFALEGSVFVGGAAIQWLRDGLKIINDAPRVNDEAAKSDDSGGVVVVPSFTGLGAPHWDPHARGAVLGLTRGTTRRHVARATLESIAFQSADVLGAMEADSGLRLPELRVDGGATRSDILMQFQADLLERPVVRPAEVESTGIGAGLLAGLAVDAWSLDDLREVPPGATVFEPQTGRGMVEKKAAWARAVDAVRAFGA